ncbi:hypothetical protein K469DRAFT_745360 [Zopfia rhizophila CBS 207.26]|uniref:Uncharacterized protein n=1 Tax=Zopfia rhizophila CBS 207.26 TaxID=1314779 RepID=A0A6A6ENZ2_9PEZI|nr:hypothetical protein K469DRAFT_745360 [Zopfia rhizophila CBS 207.26]
MVSVEEIGSVKNKRVTLRCRKGHANYGKVNYANTHLEQLDTLLEWITGQFAEIATEYASSSWGSQHNRDLLDGWERYYVYIDAKDQPDEARLAWIERMHPQESVKWLKALLAWIEREFPQIAAKYAPSSQDSPSNGDNQDQDQVVLPYSKPSPSEPRRKASPSEMAGKSTRRKGEFARKRSALSQVQSSKVSKPVQRRRRPLDQKLSTTRHGVWPPEGHVNDVGQVEEQEPSKVAVRRSERISRRTRDPAPPSPGLVRPKKSSQRLPDSTVRRSARILDRNKKIRSLGPDLDVKMG